jgi:hypothetical protein
MQIPRKIVWAPLKTPAAHLCRAFYHASSAKILKIPPVFLRFLPMNRGKLHGKSAQQEFLEVPVCR